MHPLPLIPLIPSFSLSLSLSLSLFLSRARLSSPQKEVVTVMSGRKLHVGYANQHAMHGLGIARFTFEELCEEPYGASDYLASTFYLPSLR